MVLFSSIKHSETKRHSILVFFHFLSIYRRGKKYKYNIRLLNGERNIHIFAGAICCRNIKRRTIFFTISIPPVQPPQHHLTEVTSEEGACQVSFIYFAGQLREPSTHKNLPASIFFSCTSMTCLKRWKNGC